MNIGDKITINGVEFTIWFIENGIFHIKNDEDYGLCGDINWLNSIKE